MLCPDLNALSSRLAAPVTRFAPSPTGYLHLGHVVNAIYVWGLARALGGRVLLRVEDHDRVRSRPRFEAALLEDLDWLGFVPDAGMTPVIRQSDRDERYQHALARLRQSQHVYACGCSRKEIGVERYPGTCRGLGLAEEPGRGLRVEIPQGDEPFEDALIGPQRQNPQSESGDLLLRDRDGHWTYQFAVTVDDQQDDVTLIVRGADLLSSTGRQIRLGRMLGRTRPAVFVHHPLLVDASGRKLSKCEEATGVRELRAAGQTPAEVTGRAAFLVGLLERQDVLRASRVKELFDQG